MQARWSCAIVIAQMLGCRGDSGASDGSEGSDEGTTEASAATAGTTDGTTETAETASSSTQTEGTSESGLPATCGDGVLDPEENCDDANRTDDDPCNSSCEVPGTLLWERVYAGRRGASDGARAVGSDANGRLVAAGQEGYDFPVDVDASAWVGTWDGDGNEQWMARYDGVAGDRDRADAVAIDGELVWVGGFVDGGAPWIARLSAAGEWTWNEEGDAIDPAGSPGGIEGLAVDPAGNLLATSGANEEVWVQKRDPEGAVQWTQTYTETAGTFGYGVAIAADAQGDVIVLGGTYVDLANVDVWVAKLDGAGAQQWSIVHAGTGGGIDRMKGLDVDEGGDIVVQSEDFVALDYDYDVWSARLSADGAVEWEEQLDSGSTTWERPLGIALDGAGHVFVATSEDDGNQDGLVRVRKLALDGTELWRWESTSRRPASIAVDPAGDVLLAGTTPGGASNDVWVGKLAR